MNKVTHFEITGTDLEKTAEFYRSVFGWKIHKWDGPVDYWIVDTGAIPGTPGINGGLMEAGEGLSGTINTIEVDDIDSVIEKVLAAGGKVVIEKHTIPGVGFQAYCIDVSGVIFGLHKTDPNFSM
jgi:predicted enzyme related to lactoylglutathione lyase